MKGIIPMIVQDNHPGDAEAAGAVAAMQEIHSGEYRPTPGDVVIGEPPYLGGRRAGIVRATNGTYCLVEMDGETLAYYPRELQWTGRRVEG